MNGADRLCDVLLGHGVDVCFANPGTSEMHFVAALDRRPDMRCVLGLFEGVATGAADGYGRMADRPAATLLHTGPGLANGLANLHNARRAHTPVINIVGDHASYHLPFDAPLASDIESLAQPMSNWVRRIAGPDDVAPAAIAAWRAARELPGVATLILPADAAWGEASETGWTAEEPPVAPKAEDAAIRDAVAAIRASGGRAGLLIGGRAGRADALAIAGRIAASADVRLFGEVFCTRAERGRGRVPVRRIPYPIAAAVETLKDLDVLILVGTREPVAFFAYPGKPSRLVPDGCRVLSLATPSEDAVDALGRLAEGLGAPSTSPTLLQAPPEMPALSGPLTDEAISQIVAALLPDDAIVCDEGLTSGRSFFALSENAAPHDYLMLSGGAIGLGIPQAVGAAIACSGRKVIGLQADGSAMYTLQGLWTQARERLDVVTVIYSNRAYAILRLEMENVGARHYGGNAERMMSLDDPALDWVSLARGMGVEGARATTAAEFADLFAAALRRRGPFLIEAVI